MQRLIDFIIKCKNYRVPKVGYTYVEKGDHDPFITPVEYVVLCVEGDYVKWEARYDGKIEHTTSDTISYFNRYYERKKI